MEKEVISIGFYPDTNTTRVYYADNTFDAFGGNIVNEKAMEHGFELVVEERGSTAADDIEGVDTAATESSFSPSEDGEETITEDNQVNYEEGNQEDGGRDSDGGTSAGVHADGEPGDSPSVPEVESADAGGDVSSLPSEDGSTGDVPSNS